MVALIIFRSVPEIADVKAHAEVQRAKTRQRFRTALKNAHDRHEKEGRILSRQLLKKMSTEEHEKLNTLEYFIIISIGNYFSGLCLVYDAKK